MFIYLLHEANKLFLNYLLRYLKKKNDLSYILKIRNLVVDYNKMMNS